MTKESASIWQPNHLEAYLDSPQVTAFLGKRSVTDEQRVEALLALANGEPLLDQVWSAMMDGTTNDGSPDAAIQREILEGNAWRDTIVAALLTLLPPSDPPTKIAPASATARSELQRCTERALISIPEVTRQGDALLLVHRVIAKNAAGAIGYAFAVTNSAPFATRLRRCKLSTCQRFFLVKDLGSKQGRRRDTFHEECAADGARERIRETMRIHRRKAKSKSRRSI